MPDKKSTTEKYIAKNIVAITPREHIRRRPQMYVGGTDSGALNHLLWEVVDNSLDEVMAGRCDHIRITLHSKTRVSIIDNGQGIPVDANECGRSALEMVMTQVGACGKFDNEAYKVSGGLHGVGVSAVNHLSAQLTAESKRDGYLWRQTYGEGLPTSPVEQVRPLAEGESTGTSITFTPDFTIMDEGLTFDYTVIVERCQELAYLLPQLTLEIERDGDILTLHQPKGLAGWVTDLNQHDECVHPILFKSLQTEYSDKYIGESKVKVELALQFRKHTEGVVMGFVNTILWEHGGTHIEGLRESLIQGIYGDNTPETDNPLYGLTAVLHIYHPDPQSEGSMHLKLLNPDVKDHVMRCVQALLTENPTFVQSLQSHFLV